LESGITDSGELMEWLVNAYFTAFFWLFAPTYPPQDFYPGDKVQIIGGTLKDCQANRVMFFVWDRPELKMYGVRGWCGKRGHIEAFVKQENITKGWVRKSGKIIY
jgi:hypothetical protein